MVNKPWTISNHHQTQHLGLYILNPFPSILEINQGDECLQTNPYQGLIVPRETNDFFLRPWGVDLLDPPSSTRQAWSSSLFEPTTGRFTPHGAYLGTHGGFGGVGLCLGILDNPFVFWVVSIGWWTKSLYGKWLAITKHPFKIGCLEGVCVCVLFLGVGENSLKLSTAVRWSWNVCPNISTPA